jgi:hypothetical protein
MNPKITIIITGINKVKKSDCLFRINILIAALNKVKVVFIKLFSQFAAC